MALDATYAADVIVSVCGVTSHKTVRVSLALYKYIKANFTATQYVLPSQPRSAMLSFLFVCFVYFVFNSISCLCAKNKLEL